MITNDKNRTQKANVLGKGRRSVSIILNVAGPATLLVLWLLVSWQGWIKPRFLPPPWNVLQATLDIHPNILVHAIYTTALVVIGLAVGTIVGFLIGLLLRHSFILRSLVTPVIESWRPVPPVAIVPFFIIWFGFAWSGKLVLVSLGTFLIVVVGVVESIDRLNPIYLRVALSFGATNWQFLRYAALPAILPSMLASLRIALALATTLAVVSEFMGATRGIGYVINVALSTFAIHTIVLCVIVLGIIGGSLDSALRALHRRIVRWAQSVEEAIQ